jgi:thioredoxin 2
MSDESTQLVCPACGAVNRLPLTRIAQRPNCGKCHGRLFTGQPLVLDARAFARRTDHEDIPLLVDFWAAWCAPCRMMAPQFEAAAHHLEPNMRLAKVDTEAEPELAARFGIRSIPTLVLLRHGREVARRAGALSASQIERWVLGAIPGG